MPQLYARLIRQSYFAATTYADMLIGEILSATAHYFPDTIVALVGDHGWSLGEHQEWSKFSNFEVSTRVPFIISHLANYKKLHSISKVSDHKRGAYKIIRKHLRQNFSSWPGNNKKSELINLDVHNLPIQEEKISQNYGKMRSNYSYEGIVELLDLFPTLADLAGIQKVKSCDNLARDQTSKDSFIKLCTEGRSLSPILIQNSKYKLRKFSNFSDRRCLRQTRKGRIAISQYPRPSLTPSIAPDSDQPRLKETIAMGYSMRSLCYRYTLWVSFDYRLFKGDFSKVFGQELYDHRFDPQENHNIEWKSRGLVRKLRRSLYKKLSKFNINKVG